MKKALGLAAVAAMGLAASASADVVINFDNQHFNSLEFASQFDVGDLSGTITAIQGNFVMNDGSGGFTTWASDLAVLLVDGNSFPGDTVLTQVGGFTNQNAVERILWDDGNSGLPGTTVNATKVLATPIDASQVSVWLGHGFNSANAWGNWSGSITLIGASVVPAPGALALLGLAGLAGASRRRRA